MEMIRKQMYFTSKQDKELRRVAKETGLSFSDVVRRILDFYIENGKIKDIVSMRELDNHKKKK